MDMFEKQFEEQKKKEAPLAARMRPTTLKEFVGQEHIVGEGRVLRKAIESGQLPSMILWGPPGSGKTTLASIIANTTASHFSSVALSPPASPICAALSRKRGNAANCIR